MNTELETLVSVTPRVVEWVTGLDYTIADDGIVVAPERDGWVLTVHTVAADGDRVVFAWSYQDIIESPTWGVIDAK